MPRIRMSRNEDNIVGSFTCSNIALRAATDAAKIEEFLGASCRVAVHPERCVHHASGRDASL